MIDRKSRIPFADVLGLFNRLRTLSRVPLFLRRVGAADFISPPAPITLMDIAPADRAVRALCITALLLAVLGSGAVSAAAWQTGTVDAAGDVGMRTSALGGAGDPCIGSIELGNGDPTFARAVDLPAANFTWAPAAPRAGEEVRFTDNSTGGPEWWEWSFGDGQTSIAQNPAHAFAAPGNYTVRLTAYYPGSEIGRDAARTVTVSAPPVGGSTGYFLVSTAPAGAAVFLRDIGGDLSLAGNTSSGPLNVTVYLTGTPVTAIVANLTGYADAVFPIASYPSAGETVPVNLTLEPAVFAVSPSTALPTDTDGDGLYDDVNGNGRKDFADVVLYFNQMSWIGANEPIPAFDYNGNGRVDFADIVWLFNAL